jgi:hypothetical protein
LLIGESGSGLRASSGGKVPSASSQVQYAYPAPPREQQPQQQQPQPQQQHQQQQSQQQQQPQQQQPQQQQQQQQQQQHKNQRYDVVSDDSQPLEFQRQLLQLQMQQHQALQQQQHDNLLLTPRTAPPVSRVVATPAAAAAASSSVSVFASAAVATPVRPSTAPSPSRLTPDEKVTQSMAVHIVLFFCCVSRESASFDESLIKSSRSSLEKACSDVMSSVAGEVETGF